MIEIKIAMPVAKDAFGQWLEEHGGAVVLTCVFGKYTAAVKWRKFHSYSDSRGQHVEDWHLSRHHADPTEAIARAVRAAMAVAAGKPIPEDCQ